MKDLKTIEGLILQEIGTLWLYQKGVFDDDGELIDMVVLDFSESFVERNGLDRSIAIGQLRSEIGDLFENESIDWMHAYRQVYEEKYEKKFEIFDINEKEWISIYVFSPHEGYFISIINSLRDIKELSDNIHTFFRLSVDMLVIAGFDGYFKEISSSWTKNFGWSVAELKSRPFIEFVHQNDRAATEATVKKLRSGDMVVNFENRYICKDGSYRWLSWNSVSGTSKEIIYAVARDITDKKEYEEKLHELNEQLRIKSVTDGLTGLYNHQFIIETLQKESKRSHRYSEELSILMMDIDKFKRVNDEYGHIMGDTVLERISETIMESIRDSDYCGRYGGEEFLVILPKTGLTGALNVAENIRREVEELSFEGDLQITISIGVAEMYESDYSKFLNRADKLLYKAKENGRNRVEFGL